ncbi:hypothetical protein QWI17_00320 [Gilvimarinus sp. SDUM040013]|uniref:Uncharacterized protein n=1 Tax=Gilvimarinus gilvus TaxID=3058038 RepID=A0ABU4S326_9GAMM|nr:hypothetical protein [Gilvimarinus sp. SDUM040013]MDO3384278.1 hypothetical protein [Gilvimarinus sp. SDUM040013]MDX6851577.1 hypothetical protein [Gilvimarinus sp. SDUM040013]
MDLIRSKFKYIVLVAFLAFIFNSSVLSILGVRSSEVMYDYDVVVAMCLPESEICPYSGEIQVANTGNLVANNLEFQVASMPSSIKVSFRILDLVASSPREKNPIISVLDDGQGFTVNGLVPGAMVIAEYGSQFSYEEREMIRNISVSGSGDSALVYGDPHGTIFGRFFSSLMFW